MTFEWRKGRQEGGYDKLKLFSSSFFGVDGYVLRMPKGCYIAKHKDPVEPGYKHYRFNITLKKSSNPTNRMYTLGKVHRWWRFEFFRPDLYDHGLEPIEDSIYMLSFGCRTKA